MEMKRAVALLLGLVVAVSLGALPRAVMARASRTPPPIRLTYRGGPLVRNVRVVELFWGPGWSGTQLPGYFSDFFRALFADGRYMGHLAQYSVKDYAIGNGTFAGAAIDSSQPPSKLSDAQIRAEIRAQVAAGTCPNRMRTRSTSSSPHPMWSCMTGTATTPPRLLQLSRLRSRQ